MPVKTFIPINPKPEQTAINEKPLNAHPRQTAASDY